MSTPISIQNALRVKGALIFDDNLAEFPSNPGPGTIVQKGQVLYAYTTINGVAAWYPLTSAPRQYSHYQQVASNEWLVQHNLNQNDLWYQIQGDAGEIVTPSNVEMLDSNTIRLSFFEAITGKVLVLASGLEGEPGMPGTGIIPGGTTGQLFAKASAADYDTKWMDTPAAGAVAANYDSQDRLLMRFQGAVGSNVFTEEIGGFNITTGGAQPPTLQAFDMGLGPTSLQLTGAGYVNIAPTNNQLNFGSLNWTIDALLYAPIQAPPYATWMANTPGSWSPGAIAFRYDNTGQDQRYSVHWNGNPVADPIVTTPLQYAPGVTRHLRYVKTGNCIKQFVNKKLVSQASLASNLLVNLGYGGALRLGQSAWDGGNGYFTGYLGFLRITAAARTRDHFESDTSVTPN